MGQISQTTTRILDERIFIDISNTIGKFIYVDPRCLGARDKEISWVLIEKHFGEAFSNHTKLRWENINLTYCLDFWGTPFRCLNSHQIGHLIANCPKERGELQPLRERKGFH